MTDYEEEQRQELEALEAIYPTEFKLIEEPNCFEITVASEHDEDNSIKFSVSVQFTYVENYPDCRPFIELKSRDGLTDNHLHSLKEFLHEKAEENLGMVMIFTLISETQEFLNEAVEKEKNSQEEERQRKLKEAEEAELAKLTGTPVTHENFIIWKLKFDEERKTDEVKIEIKNKLTGRQLFEQNALMGTLDEAFMGDDIKVDESLFQDLDDLDLDDDDLNE
ncbi:RWD domain-containing protein 1-like [Xenia sp. Carnegie-2017]|uniref:RWD domain-containing protein 1-like n=1 Tax=Xenia sp. Carnegie-2017 TaxID=2897299 RepID=UPI001F034216|nr:RWD domain-containing protein 1-like [Xenia sp. Carnegie-2017]